MIIGIPKETKVGENRVALTPAGVAELTHRHHTVLVESGAGVGAGFADEEYAEQGAEVVGTGAEVLVMADLVVKVKEPTPTEVVSLSSNQILFTYLHLAAKPELAGRMSDLGLTAVAYETVESADRTLPLLAPMSEIAGRISVQAGATLPYIIAIADLGLDDAIERHPGLEAGVNIKEGTITHPGVAAALDGGSVHRSAAIDGGGRRV